MHRLFWLIGALLVSGCSYDLTDPYQRPGTYNPTATTTRTCARWWPTRMTWSKARGQGTSTGAEAAPPVARLLAGQALSAAATECGGHQHHQPEPQQQGAANPGTAQ